MKIGYLILLSLLSLSVHAESMYRWTDENGKVHYSDQPPSGNPKSVQEKNIGSGINSDPGQLPYGTQVAMKRSPVTLYSSTTCGDICAQAKALLTKRGIPFSEKNANDVTEAEKLKKLIGTLEVPVLIVGETKLRGLEEPAWHSALDVAGYPSTTLKPVNPQTAPANK